MRIIPLILSFLACSACSKTPSTKQICDHVGGVLGESSPARCVENMDRMASEVGAEKFKSFRQCLMAANDKAAIETCASKLVSKDDVDKYANKSKAAEAVQMVKMMADAATVYYHSPPMDFDSMAVTTPGFPESVGPTPPKGACCQGEGGTCQPDAELWQHPSWQALMFSLRDPHRYSYEFERHEDGKGFNAFAYGDLDCDGTYSTFQITGTLSQADGVELGLLVKTEEME